MIKPKVENKYNLKFSDIHKMIVLDRDRIHEAPFWRNTVIDAWCLSETTIKTRADDEFGTYDEYWIGIYDDDAKAYAGKIRANCSSYGGMCHYDFEKFFREEDIEHKMDLEIQEKLMTRLNWLLDEKILGLREDKI